MIFHICIRWGNPLWDHTPCPLDLDEEASCDGCSFLHVWDLPSHDDDLDNETSGS